ncbi:MAG: sugar transporter permease [Paenibacillus sp.]|nr:sugar transporter permease [Paenibacillus sp.]
MAGKKDFWFQTANALMFLLFAFVCLYPFYYIFLVSVSDADAVSRGSVLLYPIGFTLDNFVHVIRLDGILSAFLISVARLAAGTLLTLFFSSMLAYIVTKKELPGRKWIYRATVYTMFVQAGLIPWFITMKTLGLQNSFLLYILPGIISPFAVILIKTYMESAISPALEESAIIDGAGYFRVFASIMVPVSMPVIAAVAVFSAVGQWNSWQDNFYLVSDSRLQTLQYLLLNFLQQAEMLAKAVQLGDGNALEMARRRPLDPFAVKTTITMVTVIPIMLVYPFLQKYFVKGIMMGAVKG